jgi:hypothetical protein
MLLQQNRIAAPGPARDARYQDWLMQARNAQGKGFQALTGIIMVYA